MQVPIEWECLYCKNVGVLTVRKDADLYTETLPAVEADHRDADPKCKHIGEEQIRCQ